MLKYQALMSAYDFGTDSCDCQFSTLSIEHLGMLGYPFYSTKHAYCKWICEVMRRC